MDIIIIIGKIEPPAGGDQQGDHPDHRHHHDDRHEFHENAAGDQTRYFGRWLQVHLTTGRAGRSHSWRPPELHGAHRRDPVTVLIGATPSQCSSARLRHGAHQLTPQVIGCSRRTSP